MVHFEERLASAGYRVTASRRAVMQVLEDTSVPLIPQEILERGSVIHPRLGIVTVYRTVKLLEDLGLACRVHRNDGCHAYVAISPGHRHHVICQECGRTVEFSGSEDLEELAARVERITNFRVHGHLLELFGLCPQCQKEGWH